MFYYRKYYAILVFLLLAALGQAQDIQFSQFYQAQLYQNPAFAGSMHEERAMLHQRIQWPSLDSRYTTSFFSFDMYNRSYNSGFGGYFLYDRQSTGKIESYEIAGQYSFELHITSFLSFRYGLQLGAGSKTLDYLRLNFPQQFDDLDGLVRASPYSGRESSLYFDASSGGIFYTTNWWLGVSMHHMNQPDQSFFEISSRLPRKAALTGGYKIILKQDVSGVAHEDAEQNQISVTPTFHLKTQGRADQFDAGIYWQYYKFILGGWYRGIPFKTLGNFQNNESLVALGGYKYHNISVTYSYDWVISSLQRANPFGAHELNLTYTFSQKRWTKPTKKVPCPQFYRY